MSLIRALLRTVGQRLEALGREPLPPGEVHDRAYDQRDPKPEDHCYEFRPGPAGGDCETDGHYLCDGCDKMNPRVAYYRKHGDWPTDDWPDDEVLVARGEG